MAATNLHGIIETLFEVLSNIIKSFYSYKRFYDFYIRYKTETIVESFQWATLYIKTNKQILCTHKITNMYITYCKYKV